MKIKSLVLAASLSLVASAYAAPLEVISIGATPVPHAEVLEFAKPLCAQQGVDLKIVEFNDYVQPNLATNEGDIDANYFQHRPYLENFNAEHNLDLIELVPVHIEPMAAYSSKIKDLKDLQDGASVSIPNDPTNGGRALLLLQNSGLITLEDPKSVTATVLDIKDNPKHLNFKELEAPQLPRSLDEVDVAIINTNYAIDAGLNPLRDAIVIEDANSPYVNVVAIRPESKDAPKFSVLKAVLNSQEVKNFIAEKYQGAVIAAF